MQAKSGAPAKPAKKKQAAPDFGISAPTPFKTPPKPPAFPHGDVHAAQAERQRKARNAMIFKARQDAAVKQQLRDRVAAQAGLAPVGKSLGGALLASTGHAAAKPEKTERFTADLTPKAQLAAARLARLRGGGLLPDGDTSRLRQPGTKTPTTRESDALAALAGSKSLTFADKHQLPGELTRPVVHLSEKERQALLRSHFDPGAGIGAPGAPAALKKPTEAGFGGLLEHLPGSVIHAAEGVGKGLARGAVSSVAHAGLGPASPIYDAATTWMPQVAKGGEKFSKAVAPKAKVPHIDITDYVTPEARAANKGKPIYSDDLSDKEKYGEYALGSEARKALVPMAERNGANAADIPTFNDQELLAWAYNKQEKSVTGFLRNAAADVGTLSSLAALPSLVGATAAQSIQQRSVAPSLKLGAQLGEGFIATAPFVGDRPWLDNLYKKPMTTALTVAPAYKWAGIRLGKLGGLSDMRSVELPRRAALVKEGLLEPGQERVQIPASQHPVTRLGQAAHDLIVRKGVHPREDVPSATSIIESPVSAARKGVANVPRRVGAKLQDRIENQRHDFLEYQARLEAGQQAHLVHNRYLTAVRKLPWVKTAIAKRGQWGAKEGEVEQIVHHEGVSHSGPQIAAAYDSWAAKTQTAITEMEAQAKSLRQEAVAMRGHARTPDTMAEAKATDNIAKMWQDEADKQKGVLETQKQAAEDFRNSDYDPTGEKSKAVQELADSARGGAKLTSQMLRDKHIIDEKGQLYGDWQHHINIILETEGPGMAFGGEHGTPAYHLAVKLDKLRDIHNQLRAEYHGTTVPKETEPLPNPEQDIRSEEAQHELGRHRLAGLLLRVIEGKQQAKAQRAAEMQARLPEGASDPVVAALNHEGLRANTTASMVARVRSKLAQGRDQRMVGEHSRFAKAGEELAAREAEERSLHEREAGGKVRRLESRVQILKTKGEDPTRIAEAQQKLDDARAELEKGFRPSRTLLGMMRQHEKLNMHIDLHEMSGAEIDNMINDDRRTRELPPEAKQVLRDALQHAADRESALGELKRSAEIMHADSAARFKTASGGKDVQMARAYDIVSERYLAALRGFAQHQGEAGHDPFHLHLHRPDDPYGLQPVRVTTGKQYAEANYTRDMHFLISKDLEGMTRKAVEGRLFQLLGEEPVLIQDPHEGAIIPPGFLGVKKDLLDNVSKMNRNQQQLTELRQEWAKLGKGTHAGQTITHDDGQMVLVSRNLKDEIEATLKAGDHYQDHNVAGSALNHLLNATNTYRRWMLYSLPRTFVNNFVGNPILAAIQGAGIKTFMESIWTLRNHPERVAWVNRRKGPISNIMEKPNAKMTGYQSMWRNLNTFAEDNGNLMVYLLHAKRAFKKENNLHWFNRVGRMDEHWGQFLKEAAEGKNPDAAEWSAKSAEMFGDMFKVLKHDKGLATLFLFHRWVGHMIHLTLWTMPTKYPGRTAFLYQTAYLADQYRKEHGVFPDWAAGMIPLWSEMQKAGGLDQKVTWALSGGGINPFATPGQTFDLGSTAQPKFPLQSAIAANITPLIRVPLEAAYGRRLDTLQPFMDYKGNEINSGMNWRVFVQGVIANTPVLNTMFPRAGLSDESIQVHTPFYDIGSQHPRYTSAAKYDASMATPTAMEGHGHELHDWLLRLLGAAGAPIRPIDAEGNRAKVSAYKTAAYQQKQQSIRTQKDLDAKAKASNELWAKDKKAWLKSEYNPANAGKAKP